MAPGGKIAYCGLMSELPQYFIGSGLAKHYEEGSNIADFALQHIKDATSTGKDINGEAVDIENRFKESAIYRDIDKALTAGVMPKEESERYVGVNMSEAGATWFMEFVTVTRRFWMDSIRNRIALGVRYSIALFFAFVLTTTFLRMGFSQEFAQERMSLLFICLIFTMFTSAMFLPAIFEQRPIYFRESGAKMYRASSFAAGKFIADAPHVIVEQFIFCIMVYYGCNLQCNFGYFWWCLMVMRSATITFVQMIGTAVGSTEDANTVMALILNIFCAFTGFLIPTNSIPAWWIWMFDISYVKYALHFLAAEEALGETYTCQPFELIPVSPDYGSQWWQCSSSVVVQTSTGPKKCPLACGKEILVCIQ
jgi:ATP-binding cassette, subfamily G (WHITE), eye pigment precursor transporter